MIDQLNTPSDFRYKSTQRLVLEYGQTFVTKVKSPFKGQPKSCFENCLEALINFPQLNYCEAFAISEFGLHFDFSTPEYSQLKKIEPKKWESTRGLGYSFGYNQNDTDLNMISVDELVDSFVDIVSKNGNLLLNIGPNADGSISKLQMERLLGLGKWLDVNGEAIFCSRYWIRSEDVSSQGIRVRYTTNKGNLYAVLLDTPISRRLTVPGLTLPKNAKITMLGVKGKLEWQQYGQNLFITLPNMSAVEKSPAYTLKISPIPLS